jgi:hypothetical protein
MKKVDFTGNFMSIDGEPAIDEDNNKIEISSYISRVLSKSKSAEPIRTMNIAKKIFDERAPLMEEHDIKYIRGVIDNLNIIDLFRAECLRRLDDAEKIKSDNQKK